MQKNGTDGARTHDNQVVTLVLSQLSYRSKNVTCCRHISTSAYAIEKTVVSTGVARNGTLLLEQVAKTYINTFYLKNL
jgi:hypothetical protein